jgi:hypothetical protein
MPPLPPAAYRYLALCVCAAWLLVDHVQLAWRAPRRALALLVPGAGALFAWREGRRVAAVRYGVLLVAYVALRLWP